MQNQFQGGKRRDKNLFNKFLLLENFTRHSQLSNTLFRTLWNGINLILFSKISLVFTFRPYVCQQLNNVESILAPEKNVFNIFQFKLRHYFCTRKITLNYYDLDLEVDVTLWELLKLNSTLESRPKKGGQINNTHFCWK